MPHLGEIIARNVRAERGRRGWRQSDLADRLGWVRSSVGHLESGRRAVRAEDLPQLCAVFEISLIRLFDGADESDWESMRLPPLQDWTERRRREN